MPPEVASGGGMGMKKAPEGALEGVGAGSEIQLVSFRREGFQPLGERRDPHPGP